MVSLSCQPLQPSLNLHLCLHSLLCPHFAQMFHLEDIKNDLMFSAYAVLFPRFYFPLNSNIWHQWPCASLLKYFPLLAFAWISFLLSLPNCGLSFLFYFIRCLLFFYLLTMKFPMCSNLFFLYTQFTDIFSLQGFT